MPRLNSLLAEIPALQAQESLRRVSEYVVGSGNLKKHQSSRIIHEWEREANLGATSVSPASQTKEQFELRMAILGFRSVTA